MTFLGVRPDARPAGVERQVTTISHFRGPRESWRTDLATYGGVVYRDLWPGIDVTWMARADHVDLTVVVAPGADPAAVAMAVRSAAGAEDAAESRRGDDLNRVARHLPGLQAGRLSAHQMSGGQIEPITARLDADGESGAGPDRDGTTFQLHVADYDPARPLVLHASSFLYAGLWGSPDYDRGLGIAVDGRGAAYLTGETWVDGTDRQAFIIKVNPAGNALDYVAYIGGDGQDAGFDIDVDAAGNAYIAGATDSRQDSFPVTMGPDLTANGSVEALVAKLDPAGTDLVYAGYIGGAVGDFAEAIRVGPDGSAYVAGITNSNSLSFPVKIGPDTTFNGRTEAFLTKIVPVPDAADRMDNFAYTGFIGGRGDDCYVYFPPDKPEERFATAGHLDLDAEGNVYLSGATTSDEASFPDGDGFGDLPGPDQTHGGAWDAWVVKVRADGAGFVYAGYLGGDGEELGFGMGVDAAGAAYFTGISDSNEDTLEPVVGPDLTFNGGSIDALAAKVAPDGRSYAYAGYLGGSASDGGTGNTVDSQGQMVIIGYAESGESFPAVGGPDLTINSTEPDIGDGFVAKVKANPDAAAPADNYVYAGYIGGNKWDQSFWVDVDAGGTAYVVGDTYSDSSSFPNGNGLGQIPSPSNKAPGEGDTFFVKVSAGDTPPETTPTSPPSTPPSPTATTHLPTEVPTPGGSPAPPCNCGRALLPWVSSGEG